jgi:hypothetical protein
MKTFERSRGILKAARLGIAGILFTVAVNAAAQDYNGTWIGIITQSESNCPNLGKAEPGEYRITILQRGDTITVMENVVQRPYRGVLDAGRPRFVQVRGTYPADGGYVAEEVDIEFFGERAGKGQSHWRWSDGWLQCGGSFTFTLEKKRSY